MWPQVGVLSVIKPLLKLLKSKFDKKKTVNDRKSEREDDRCYIFHVVGVVRVTHVLIDPH